MASTARAGHRNPLRRLAIRTKILVLVGLTAVITVTLGVTAAVNMDRMRDDSATMASTQTEVGGSLSALKDDLWTVRNTTSSLSAYDGDTVDAQVDTLAEANAHLDEDLATFAAAYQAAAGRLPENYEEFTTSLDFYRTTVEEDMVPIARAGDRAALLVSLSELRRGFEPAAAALAARRADPHQCRVMAAAVSDMVVHGRSGDLEAYLLADKVFHQTLLQASGNEMFRALNGVVAEVLTGRTHHGMMPDVPNPAAIELHDEVARAIRLRDEVAAERAMRAIIDEAVSAVTEEFSNPA